MASLQTKNGRLRIQFQHPTKGRQTLRLGKIDKSTASRVKLHVEQLVSALRNGLSAPDDTRSWLKNLTNEFYSQLAGASLVEKRSDDTATPVSLDAFLARYIAGRAGLRPNTVRNHLQTRRILCEYFGGDRDIQTINPGDADAYKEHLIRNRYSPATIAREIKRSRQFFQSAVRNRLIAENPFQGITAGKQTNRDRAFFIDTETTAAVLDACPNDDWRLIFSLCRFQGLRCPSEVLSLKWSDVQWGENGNDVLIIRACKTPERRIPIFAETRPVLLSAQEKAPSDQQYVIGGYRDSNSNLRTQFQRILTKAGISSWPRLFHNLRASRETELMSHFPSHVVETWLGNTSKVAKDHYLQVTPDHIREATQKATHHPVETACNTLHAKKETAVSPAIAKDTAVQIPPRGVEPRFSG